MTSQEKVNTQRPKGIAYILALLLLAVLSALAVAFASTTDLNLRKSDNTRSAQAAMLAAESGLQFAMRNMAGMQSQGTWTGTPDMLALTNTHLASLLNGTANMSGHVVSYNTGAGVVSVPNIALPDGSRFNFSVSQVNPSALQLVVNGIAGGITRSLGMQYAVHEDTSVMSYAVTSRPRMIIRGNAKVDGAICSGWTRIRAAPPFDIRLGTEGYITDGIKTVLSEGTFTNGNCPDYIDDDLMDTITYNEPPISDYTTADFNTTTILNEMTANGTRNDLPTTTTTVTERFPNKLSGVLFTRLLYTGQIFNWTYIPRNKHCRFRNCTFTGITYVDSAGITKTTGNNIVFENCTFKGPIVTNVPSSFQWQYNSLNFEGDTTFSANDIAPHLNGCTILAPNFNVNVGDFQKQGKSSDSKITGILVGGIVDIRDNATIEGTIMSMADLDSISNPYAYGTNLGYWEGDAEEGGGTVPMTLNIRITPTPGATLPMGIIKKYTVSPDPDTYSEGN